MTQGFNKGLTDKEIDLFVQALLLPPPFGFSKAEKKQILDWLKTPSVFVEMAAGEHFGAIILKDQKILTPISTRICAIKEPKDENK